MNVLRPKAESQVAYDPEKTDVVAPARYDAFALPILVAYVVFMLPVLVLRVVALSLWARLRGVFRPHLCSLTACFSRLGTA